MWHQLHSQRVGQDRLGQENLEIADVGDSLENILVMIRSSKSPPPPPSWPGLVRIFEDLVAILVVDDLDGKGLGL